MSRIEPINPSLRHVHQAMPHDSAFKHVQGAADYIDDIREPEGTLHVAVGGSPAARGRIVRIDLGKVRAFPGVHAVITASNVPGKNDISPANADEPVFAAGHVLFHGQPVFAVIAATRDIARRAAALAVIEIDRERPHVTVEQGLGSG
jgi:xanthine dehydrogenase large subunit